MLMRKIDHARERSILKTKTHTRWVGVRRNAYNGIHQLVEHTPVRNNQVTSGRSLQQSLQCLTCAQVQSPIPLSNTPDGVIRCCIGGSWLFSNFLGSKPCHLTDIPFHPDRIILNLHIQCRSDDLCRLSGTDQCAGDCQIEFHIFRFPALSQRTHLCMALLCEWIISLSLPAGFDVENRFAMT